MPRRYGGTEAHGDVQACPVKSGSTFRHHRHPEVRWVALILEKITERIIGAAIEVHRHLGPGLMESAYRDCLAFELREVGLEVQTELVLPVVYKSLKLEAAYRLDLLVSRAVVVEVKAIRALEAVHEAQLLTYLRFTALRVGLLINFNEAVVRSGIRRLVL